jgi:hypothetical protein
MERILDELQVSPKIENQEYLDLCVKAGLRSSLSNAGKYQEITISQIEDYLKRVIQKRLTEIGGKFLGYERTFLWRSSLAYCDFPVQASYRPIGLFRGEKSIEAKWKQVFVSNYEGFPPAHILNRMIAERSNFDHLMFVTVSVNENAVPDPLLIGVKGSNRYLLDWWNDDIDPTELMK